MLELKSISVDIQNSPILRDLSMEVNSGELVCLVGRNGAGKTTTLKSIMGYLKPKLGSIRLEGEEIIGNKTFEIARKGVGFAPEESEVFGDLTVEENIEMSTWTIKTKLPEKDRIDLAYKIFPKLEGYRERSGNHLSGGERKMLSIARALTLDPKILILDEPFEGLSPAIIPLISEGISSIRKMGRAVLMAESNAFHIPEYADRVYVIERGEIVFSGSVSEATSNSYLSMKGG